MSVYENPLVGRWQAIKEEFFLCNGWAERYEVLVDKGKNLESPNPAVRLAAHEVPGCLSPVWFSARVEQEHLVLEGDAEALAPRALIVLIMDIYQGCEARAVLDWQGDPGRELGLHQYLTPNRARLLDTMMQRVRQCARESLA